MEVLDCRIIKEELLKKLKKELEKIDKILNLTIIQIGEDERSNIYVKKKIELFDSIGMEAKVIKYNENVLEDEIVNKIKELNNNNEVDGILVQLPIPKKFNINRILNTISYLKDVDGLTDINKGKLLSNNCGLIPCTAKGIIDIFDYKNIDLTGKNIVIVGRSELVGKPLFNMLVDKNSTVTLCHSKTKNLSFYTKNADILIVAVGIPKFIRKSDIKKEAIIIDVGINRIKDKICGDVDFDNVSKLVSLITPVPNGVGQMTTYEVLYNTYKAYKMRKENKDV